MEEEVEAAEVAAVEEAAEALAVVAVLVEEAVDSSLVVAEASEVAVELLVGVAEALGLVNRFTIRPPVAEMFRAQAVLESRCPRLVLVRVVLQSLYQLLALLLRPSLCPRLTLVSRSRDRSRLALVSAGVSGLALA